MSANKVKDNDEALIGPEILEAFDNHSDLGFLAWAHNRAAKKHAERPEMRDQLEQLMTKGAAEAELGLKNEAIKTITEAMKLAEKEGDEDDVIIAAALLEAILDDDDRAFHPVVDVDNLRLS